MERPETVSEALYALSHFDEVSWYQGWVNTVLRYIESLEMLTDTAYKTLEELDEVE